MRFYSEFHGVVPSSRRDLLQSTPMHERFYRALYRVRHVEEEIARIYPTDKIKSPVHLSIGQEAVSVGVCEALEPQDIVFGTYRGHALYLAKGGNLNAMIAELYGKVTGGSRGKGGSMHLIDTAAGMMGTSAVVGTTIPHAVGYAFALVAKSQTDTLVASFFGDGATEEGVFYESLNFAALKKLPVLFVCENNGYAIHTPQRQRQLGDNIAERVQAFGIPAERIDGGDALTIYERVRDIAQQVRNGRIGPYFIECQTYRWKEHVGPNEDFNAGYRSQIEAQPWFESDSVARIGQLLGSEIRQAIETEVSAEVRAAFEFAEASDFPLDHELYAHVFRED